MSINGLEPAAGHYTNDQPVSIVMGDFNKEWERRRRGRDYYGGDEGGRISILLGIGDGTFGVPQTYSSGGLTISLVSGDFNHDGNLALVTANLNSGDVSVFLENGDGAFPRTSSSRRLRPNRDRGPRREWRRQISPQCHSHAELPASDSRGWHRR
jgi:hypothetical protein